MFIESGKWITRVSLSDRLAWKARIWGYKDLRLLRDRPAEGATFVRKNLYGFEEVE